MNSVVFYIGLGTNLGDRAATLSAAIADLKIILAQKFSVSQFRVAPWYESAPIGEGANGGAYLNTVAEGTLVITEIEKDAPISSDLLNHSARALLQVLHQVEFQHGRVRDDAARNQARTLDLDLLLFGDLLCDAPDLTVPHPRMHERAFVLKPLLALTPEITIPHKGEARNYLLQVAEQELTLIANE